MGYDISEQAKQDINDIWLYTFQNWSIEQADKYVNLIIDKIEFISQNPKSGKDYSKIRNGYFRSKVESYFIFYTIDKQKRKIQIIRVLHKQMDVDKKLK